MIYFPNCKINIGLNVVSRRPDGYHDLESVFFPLALRDAVELIEDNSLNDVYFTQSGKKVGGDPEKNLCIMAYRMLKKDHPALPFCRIHLHKHIPEKAGLGGGSADAAFTLKLINEKFRLGLPKEQLLDYALRLGSDCPFFIINRPALATGRGEQLEPVSLDLSPYSILLVHPGISVETKWAYSRITPSGKKDENLKTLIKEPIRVWKDKIFNDFEKPVFEAFPAIRELKEAMYRAGALYASMSGSGSAVFGIFEKKRKIDLPAGYFQKWI